MNDYQDAIPYGASQYNTEEIEEAMEDMRSEVLARLTKIEKAALFEQYDEFWVLYREELEEKRL